MDKIKKIEIPETAKVFEFTPLIEVCGDCGGTGKKDDIYTRTCLLCNGSGRVIKTKTVIIDIKPYK